MVHIHDLENNMEKEDEKISSRAIQDYIQDENKIEPLTSAFFITEKIMADISRDQGSIPQT